MGKASPLSQGMPFFVFMGLGTYVLSMYMQIRYDFVVRSLFAAVIIQYIETPVRLALQALLSFDPPVTVLGSS
jgi:hypothetical protein